MNELTVRIQRVTLVEEAIEEQGFNVRIFLVSGGDIAEENGLDQRGERVCNQQKGLCYPHFDNATTAPDTGNTGVVQMPTQLFGGLAHKHEALCIRNDLGSIESLLQVVNELLLVAAKYLLLRASNNLAGTAPLCLQGGQRASKDGLADKRD